MNELPNTIEEFYEQSLKFVKSKLNGQLELHRELSLMEGDGLYLSNIWKQLGLSNPLYMITSHYDFDTIHEMCSFLSGLYDDQVNVVEYVLFCGTKGEIIASDRR